MARSRTKMRIADPKRFIIAAAVALAVLILLISLISGVLSKDKIEDEIKEIEGGDIVVTDRRFSTTLADGSVAELGDVITFKLLYCYQREDKAVKAYEVTDGVSVAIEGETEETPSTIGKVEGNTVKILDTAKAGEELKVIVSHKYMEDMTFTYIVGNTEVIE